MDTQVCEIHDTDMRQFTKDGRSWYSHKLEDGTWCNGKPKTNYRDTWERNKDRFVGSLGKPEKPQDEKPDWDAIAEGKVRHGLMVAKIQHDGLMPLTDDDIDVLEDAKDWIMNGRKK